MEITEVKVFPINKEDDKLKAFVTLVLDGCFIVRDLKVIRGNSGLFVAMPSRKRADGTYVDIAHPINTETRQWMERIILEEYTKLTGDQSRSESANPASTK